jgi:catechol 2,3-dioxygenase-like lactoylglutathione lyase family enzyme
MISGAHVVIYSNNAEADRAFFRDILGFKSVDAGHGWLTSPYRRQKPHFIPLGKKPMNSTSFATT